MKNNNSKKAMKRVHIISLSIIALIILLMTIVPNALTTGANPSERKLPIYCVNTTEKKIAISFDAAWGNEDTRDILDILKNNKVKATFFMTGEWIEKYPEDVKAIHNEGHELGNHSMNHKQMSTLSYDECISEIKQPHDLVKELTGVDMVVFRPPYGDYNNTLIEATESIGYSCIQWDVDSLDWKDYGVESIIDTVCNHSHLGNGSIILMHNGATHTAAALDSLIKNLKNQGYEFVKMSELIYTDNYYLDHEGRQHQITSTTISK